MQRLIKGDQTTHAVAIEKKRYAGLIGGDKVNEGVCVLPEIVKAFDVTSFTWRLAVASQIVTVNREAMPDQGSYQIVVTAAVIAETVYDNYNCARSTPR
jgi:hypothetical protein